jgi:hypothetical protein
MPHSPLLDERFVEEEEAGHGVEEPVVEEPAAREGREEGGGCVMCV